jgi:transcriptional regulator with XRE-family HTH domain
MGTLQSNLNALMQQRRLNSRRLAQLAGIAQPIVYRLLKGETRNPRLDTLQALAKACGVSVSALTESASQPSSIPILETAHWPRWQEAHTLAKNHFSCSMTAGRDSFALEFPRLGPSHGTPYRTLFVIEPYTVPLHGGFAWLKCAEHGYVVRQYLNDTDQVVLQPLNRQDRSHPMNAGDQLIGAVTLSISRWSSPTRHTSLDHHQNAAVTQPSHVVV